MKWGTPKDVKFREGDEVLVGRRGDFGRPIVKGTVAADWDGQSQVSVILEGKTKPVLRSAALLRHANPENARRSMSPVVRATRPSTTKAALQRVARPRPPLRSERYLAFVRAHPCCACQRTKTVEPHHWAPHRGISQKVSDLRTVPLCRDCHAHFHEHGRLPGLDARTTRQLFSERQVDLLEEWISDARERARAKRSDDAR